MNFLGREWLAMAAVVLVHVWRILPLSAVILMAGLTSIPQDLIDQAEVDGASFWRIHLRVRLPLIMPIMSIALLFGLIFTFGDLVVVFVLTRGGPVYYTHVLSTWAYFTGIQGGALAQGAAIALFLFPLLAAVAFLVLRNARRMEVT
jgi:multiple sugar transport system permease protein